MMWCMHCQKGDHNDRECWSTRATSTWSQKTPEQIIADIQACVDLARAVDDRPIVMYVYDSETDCVRVATASDFNWVLANGQWQPTPIKGLAWPKIPKTNGLVERLEANEREIRRVQPRVIRNQCKHHPIKAFRRPW